MGSQVRRSARPGSVLPRSGAPLTMMGRDLISQVNRRHHGLTQCARPILPEVTCATVAAWSAVRDAKLDLEVAADGHETAVTRR